MKENLFFLLAILILSSCSKGTKLKVIDSKNLTVSHLLKNVKTIKNWHLKDIQLDSIPGISLERAYDSILTNKTPKEKIIVAVLDGEIDIEHEFLKTKIWTNINEISNNNIDDDGNGYIDDVHGWNFLGNEKGEKSKYVNFEVTRILRNINPYFDINDTLSITNSQQFNSYQKKIIHKYAELYIKYMAEKENFDSLYSIYFGAKDKFNKHFIDKPYNLKEMDSLYDSKIVDIPEYEYSVLYDCIKYEIDDSYVIRQKEHTDEIINKMLNLEYDDRIIQGDNSEDLQDISYGNSIVNGHINFMTHATKMAGIIANISLNNEIEIMSLPISAYGDEHDKDIALAIRYAVDNGAKVINMSFYKEFSLHKEWVFDAFKYAADNDVLIVGIAGNDNSNLNEINYIYPNDNENNDKEVSNNFVMLGASSYSLKKDLLCDFSSYGNKDVDLFAPGTDIYTTLPNNEYTNTSNGTSSAAAITSGVAALIRSYYPSLSASQVKHTLMNSGVEYTFDVKVGDTLMPFNTLSKSGKILNAYNAMIMADSISRAN
jgi:subtilisin family serine protease